MARAEANGVQSNAASSFSVYEDSRFAHDVGREHLSGLIRTRIGENCVLDTSGDGACGLHA